LTHSANREKGAKLLTDKTEKDPAEFFKENPKLTLTIDVDGLRGKSTLSFLDSLVDTIARQKIGKQFELFRSIQNALPFSDFKKLAEQAQRAVPHYAILTNAFKDFALVGAAMAKFQSSFPAPDTIAKWLPSPMPAFCIESSIPSFCIESPIPAFCIELKNFLPGPYAWEKLTGLGFLDSIAAREVGRFSEWQGPANLDRLGLTPVVSQISPRSNELTSFRSFSASEGLWDRIASFPSKRVRDSVSTEGAERKSQRGVSPGAFIHSLAGFPYLVQKLGEHWLLMFDGKPAVVSNSKGLSYIVYLLQNPNRTVSAADLFAGLADLKILPMCPADPIADKTAMKAYRLELSDLKWRLEEAERNNDLGTKQILQEQHDFLTNQILSARGFAGRSRESKSDRERTRKSVSNAINRAITNIRESLPRLAEHLERNIDCGYVLSYRGNLPWNF